MLLVAERGFPTFIVTDREVSAKPKQRPWADLGKNATFSRPQEPGRREKKAG